MKQILIFFFFITIIACTSDNEQDYFGLCDTENIYYNSNDPQKSISHIIASKCLGCHSKDNMSMSNSWVTLETYNQLSSYKNLDEIINDLESPMPPVESPALTDCEKSKIESWVHNGFAYEE